MHALKLKQNIHHDLEPPSQAALNPSVTKLHRNKSYIHRQYGL